MLKLVKLKLKHLTGLSNKKPDVSSLVKEKNKKKQQPDYDVKNSEIESKHIATAD